MPVDASFDTLFCLCYPMVAFSPPLLDSRIWTNYRSTYYICSRDKSHRKFLFQYIDCARLTDVEVHLLTIDYPNSIAWSASHMNFGLFIGLLSLDPIPTIRRTDFRRHQDKV